LQDLGVDGRILVAWILGIGMKGEDWIHLAQNREKWRNVVNTVLNHRVSKNSGRLLTSYAAASFSVTTLLQAVRMLTTVTRLQDGRPANLGSFRGCGRDLASSSQVWDPVNIFRAILLSEAQGQNKLAISDSVKNVWRQTSTAAHTSS
jgi:hypothetical protein